MTTPRKPLAPKAFLMNQRPDAYSDSSGVSAAPRIEAKQLEYHLDQITPSKQESEFEAFCHRLVSIEISPNLIPQTGPVGGGDSKADARTHPVSSELRHRYWYSIAAASGEQFAFAFSAKKAWTGKVRSDVAGIMTWPHPPKHIYFVTNQAARDQTKKKLEDELHKKHGVPVTILDRKWIVSAIVDHHLEELVEQHLHIPLERPATVRQGPRDVMRAARVEELKNRLSRPIETYGGANSYLMIEEYLEAAMTAREIGVARVEIDGFLASARTAAAERGYVPHTIRILYQSAWTALFYYEDPAAAWRYYLELEPLAFASGDSEAESYATTVITTLRGAASVGAVPQEILPDIVRAAERIERHLGGVRDANLERPRGWRAACDLELFRLTDSAGDEAARRSHVRGLVETLDEHGSALELPVRRYLDLVTIAMSLAEAPSADDDSLFRTVTKIGSARISEVDTGTMFCMRGGDALSGGRTRTALRFLAEGRALLLKAETRARLVQTTLLISTAYRQLDLPHAALAEATIAIRHAAQLAEAAGRPDHLFALVVSELACAAAACGDTPQLLEALQVFVGARAALSAELGERLTSRLDGELARELVALRPDSLGTTLRAIRQLLLAYAFPRATLAVAFVSGDHADLSAEGIDIADAMRQFLEQEPVREALRKADARAWAAGATFSTSVLGLPVTVQASTVTTQRLALCLLGGIEAFVGASSRRDACPWPTRVNISIEERGAKLAIASKETGPQSSWLVECPPSYRGVPGSAKQEEMFSIVVDVVASSFVFGLSQATRTIEDLLRDDKVLERIAPVLQAIGAFSDRDTPLVFDPPRERWWTAAGLSVAAPPIPGGPPERPPYGGENESHSGNQLGLISLPDWDEARWRGVGYVVDDDAPPELGLLFENETAAMAIFRGLISILGEDDEKRRMSVGLIVADDDPTRYVVVVTSTVPAAPSTVTRQSPELFSIVSRMFPTTTTAPDLRDAFARAAQAADGYVLRAAVIDTATRSVRPLAAAIVLHSIVAKRVSELDDIESAMFGMAKRALEEGE